MREIARPAALAACALSTTALAASSPQLTATPRPVGFGQTPTITGTRWSVNEFCKRRVRLSLRSAENAFTIATAAVAGDGAAYVRRSLGIRIR